MHRLLGTLLFSLGAALASPAQAVDVTGADEAFDWTGFRVGAIGGYGRIGEAGPLIGASVGYDWRFDDVIVGVEGDLSGGGVDGRREGGRYGIDLFGTIRARVGYAFDRFVVYGAAGAAFASADYARDGARDSELHTGWTIGAGVETHLFGALTARAEFIYVDLDRRSFDVGQAVGFNPDGGQVRLGLNYRF
ncbi:outer membrane protein [Methylopila henanensis]|uniref:Outer membrane protein n=1 Tax=Methylopila henanensis TaxID=873516 RepID=A0ABW4K880_9HYPH